MTASSARLLLPVGPDASVLQAPGYRVDDSAADNARDLAQWLWGGLRSQWCATLTADLVADGLVPTDGPEAPGWVAGVLCAAAADAGRAVRPGTWSRTVAGIAAAAGVDRETALARHAELVAADRTQPRGLPDYWRREA